MTGTATPARAVHDPVMGAINGRRSIRAYAGDPLTEHEVRALLHAAVMAPTAMHEEPWGFAVVQDRAWLRVCSDRAKSLMLGQMAHEGAATPGAALEMRRMLEQPSFNIFYDAGTLIVVCRRFGGPFADADCWLAAENLMLEAHSKGFGTCCIGFAVSVLNQPDVKAELAIPKDGAAVAPIIVGRPREEPARTHRKPPEILRWLSPPD